MYKYKTVRKLPEHLFLRVVLSLGTLKYFFNDIEMKFKYVENAC